MRCIASLVVVALIGCGGPPAPAAPAAAPPPALDAAHQRAVALIEAIASGAIDAAHAPHAVVIGPGWWSTLREREVGARGLPLMITVARRGTKVAATDARIMRSPEVVAFLTSTPVQSFAQWARSGQARAASPDERAALQRQVAWRLDAQAVTAIDLPDEVLLIAGDAEVIQLETLTAWREILHDVEAAFR